MKWIFGRKTLLTWLIFLLTTPAFAQKSCKCEADPQLKEIINCAPILFDNHAQLFWSFNCDSSWLTFQSPSTKCVVIYSLAGPLESLTGRLGYIYQQEFRNTFLIQNNVISGCCSPPEFYLLDKTTGKVKVSLGRLLYCSENKKMPFTIGITNSNYQYEEKAEPGYNSLTVYNIDKGKKYVVPIPKGRLKKALQETEQVEPYPEYLFEEPQVKGTTVVLKYRFKKPQKVDDSDALKTITVDLSKYRN